MSDPKPVSRPPLSNGITRVKLRKGELVVPLAELIPPEQRDALRALLNGVQKSPEHEG